MTSIRILGIYSRKQPLRESGDATRFDGLMHEFAADHANYVLLYVLRTI